MISESGRREGQVSDLLRRGAKFLGEGKPSKALRAFDDAIAIDPANADAHCQRGNALADQGMPHHALASYERAILLSPHQAEPHGLRGIVLAQAERMPEALASFERALSIDPGNPDALRNRALALKHIGLLDEALRAFDRVIAVVPDASAHHERAHILALLERHGEALEGFETATRLDPFDANAQCNRATALGALDRTDAAIQGYQEALRIDPDHVGALSNLASALARNGAFEEAVPLYRRALALQPAEPEIWSELASALTRLRRFEEAGKCLQHALKLDLSNVRALLDLAHTLEELGRFSDELVCYDHILALEPGNAYAHYRRGVVLGFLGRHEEELASVERALAIDPLLEGAQGYSLYAAHFISDWTDFDTRLALLCDGVATGIAELPPFSLLSLKDDPALQLMSARNFAGKRFAGIEAHAFTAPLPRHDRIRIGYFSADFHHHATLQLFMETLEAHDRSRFELVAFSLGRPRSDEWRQRAEAAFDRMIDAHFVPDVEVAAQARAMEIDIAIDLKGYTREARMAVFAERAAPVQVSYLGYPGTTGLATMDYVLADRILISPETAQYYSEKIIYLPGSYQPNFALRPLQETARRGDHGLAEDAFVFCCFNRSYKILPAMFDSWMRILGAAPGSVLWLWAESPAAQANLKKEAARRGIAAERLIFAAALPTEAHLARLRLADLFLDTLPYNAHTTASDALKAGLPLLTCAGRSFASRVAASLLHAVGLPELVAQDLAAYEALAIEFARDRERHAALRTKLAERASASSLYDPVGAARKLEAAYMAIHERAQQGLPPTEIFI